VLVSATPWQDLRAYLAEDAPDLLILEHPSVLRDLSISTTEALTDPVCDLAIVRGPWCVDDPRILVPLRGGPYAELALRLSLALPHRDLLALHLSQPGATARTEPAFQGLERVLPRIAEITYLQKSSLQPAQTILEHAREADLVILGASGTNTQIQTKTGPTIEQIFREAPCAVAVVRTRQPLPVTWVGPEGERAGAGAISLLVDKWFAENTYDAGEFDDLEQLVQAKRAQNLSISLALPALNEGGTVGNVICTVRDALVQAAPLLDEIVLIDSNSSDQTREIAAGLGVPVHIHQQLLPEYGARPGKGEALWKSLLVTRGDIVVWIDTDIVNIHPRFVYGVVGPLLANPRLQFVKGFYQRPLRSGDKLIASGGGRVTELTARPLLNLFYPELSGVIQPLSGEYGGRRQALEQLPFFSGYGVEIGLLIDIFEKFGLSAIAQVDLQERVHHNQSLEALSKMSFTILQAFFRKLELRYGASILEEVNKTMKLIRYDEGNYFLDVQEVAERERPPMLDVPEYRRRRGLLGPAG
jgi:glucosyl-3-phosphoglycerate synthase